MKAYFAAGCFWGVESAYRMKLGKGVLQTRVGYMGGTLKNPDYRSVCSGKTGHAEVVEVVFDPAVIEYRELVHLFFRLHDPTTLNRQGPDVGTQYRSEIFVTDQEQEKIAGDIMQKWQNSGEFSNPVVTVISFAQEFYPAEDYHQQYNEKRGYGMGCHRMREGIE